MRRQCGAPRKLTNAQMRRVLQWNASGQQFLQKYGTVQSVARREGLSVSVVRRYLRQLTIAQEANGRAHPQKKGAGRPATLTPQQRQTLIRWQRAHRRFLTNRPSAAQLAQQLGVSRFTVFDCIKRGGRYVQRHQDDIACGGDRTSGVSSTRSTRHEQRIADRAARLAAWPIAGSTAHSPHPCRAKRRARRAPRGHST